MNVVPNHASRFEFPGRNSWRTFNFAEESATGIHGVFEIRLRKQPQTNATLLLAERPEPFGLGKVSWSIVRPRHSFG